MGDCLNDVVYGEVWRRGKSGKERKEGRENGEEGRTSVTDITEHSEDKVDRLDTGYEARLAVLEDRFLSKLWVVVRGDQRFRRANFRGGREVGGTVYVG